MANGGQHEPKPTPKPAQKPGVKRPPKPGKPAK